MEELNNHSNSEENGSVDSLEVRFNEFCKNGLSMGEGFMVEARKLFKESRILLLSNNAAIGAITQEEIERYWFVFVLFSVRRLSENEARNASNGNGFDLCQILRGAKLNVLDFFKELPQFIVKVGPILSNLYGSGWEKRLQAKELQTNFVHLSLLSKYYKRAYQELFLSSNSNEDKQSATANSTILLPQYYRFGWLLFLSLREYVFSRFKDLVTCTNGLVSVLAILIIHVPVCFRNFNINDSPRFVKKGDKVDLLVSLSTIYQTSIDDLRETMDKVNSLITEKLKSKPCLDSECKAENLEHIDTDGLTYFENLLEESSLSSSISTLEKDYSDAIQNKGELDERIFVNDEDSLLGSGSLSGGAVNMNGIKKKFDTMASPTKTITSPLSPYRSPGASNVNNNPNCGNSKMAATPVTTAMTTARWLRTVIAPLQPKPSAELERFLSSCDRNVSADVIRRAHIILEAIFPSSGPGELCAAGSLQSTSLMDNIWAEQRRSELKCCKTHFKNCFLCSPMASFFHFPTSHTLFFTSSRTPSICIPHNHHFSLICRPKSEICASIKKTRASRKVKSNDDLCNDIREFLSSVGLPEDHVPTMKELSQHGRQDLANIVRRRGYKLIKELLLTSKQPTYECSGEDGLVEKSEDESLVDDYTNDADNDITLNSDEHNSGDQEPLGYSSLEEKVAKFIQNGELDSVEDSGFEIFQRGEQVEESVGGQNVIEAESITPKEYTDLVYKGDGAEIFSGNPMTQSTQHVEHPSRQNSPMRNDRLSNEYLAMTEGRISADTEPHNMEIQAEINHLKFVLHQKELELAHLKQQIEEEKRLLAILQIKAETEIREAQRLISEKDAELNAAEDSLSGLKEVEILYRADGENVEVAGSFNGWHNKIKMEPQESSDPIGEDTQASSDIEDIQASSNIVDPISMRKPRLWKTLLWLYPGIYEIKFVVDDHWTTDPQRETATRGSIHNNVLRVDR